MGGPPRVIILLCRQLHNRLAHDGSPDQGLPCTEDARDDRYVGIVVGGSVVVGIVVGGSVVVGIVVGGSVVVGIVVGGSVVVGGVVVVVPDDAYPPPAQAMAFSLTSPKYWTQSSATCHCASSQARVTSTRTRCGS